MSKMGLETLLTGVIEPCTFPFLAFISLSIYFDLLPNCKFLEGRDYAVIFFFFFKFSSSSTVFDI